MEKSDISVATLLRMKAEKIMKSRHSADAWIADEGDILKLLHELEVYSVELEIQNEELLNATKEASEIANKNKFTEEIKQRLLHEFEVSQIELEIQNEELALSNTISIDVAERYSDLFNFSPSGYVILSKGGEILDLNHSVARLLGKERLKLKNSRLGFFISEYDRPAFNDFLANLFKYKSRITSEVSLSIENSRSINVLLSGILTHNEDQCLITILDITERKLSSKYREMTREVLQVLIEPGDIKEILHHTLGIMKERTGFDAIGIRLQDGIDFPYSEQAGFSKDFILEENSLIELDKQGKVCRDKNGEVRLACTCGLVISGKADQEDPHVTPGGSWWTNDSAPIVDIPAGKDARYHPRNHCIHKGYASIALVPIRNNEKIVGLIQFNDYRNDVFNLNKIEFLEGIAAHIGAALMRKQAEETLRKNEELLRTITLNAPDIIIQLDRNGSILYMNRPMPGYGMNQCLGKSFREWTLPEYHTLMNQSLHQVFEESSTQTYLSKGNDLTGETRWYRSSISPVIEGGIVEKAILITRDITESMLAEEILRESEEKRKTILMTAMDGFWISDRQGCILEINDAYCRMSGYTRQELLTMRVQELEVNENEKEVKAHIQKLILQGEERFETRHRCKDGSIINIDASVQYKKIQGGVFIAFLHNITNRIKREKAMFESNEQFRLLFENSLDAILFTNPDGSVYSVNPEAERMLGRSKEEIIGLQKDGISDVHDPRLEPALKERRETGRFKGELSFIRKDGTPFPVDITSTLFRDSNGIVRTSIIARDITERRKAEDFLKRSEERHRLLSETMLQGVVHQNAEGRIISMNPAAERILGKSMEQFLGSTSVKEEHDTVREDGSLFPGEEHPAMVTLRTGESQQKVIMGVFNPILQQYRWISIDSVPLFRNGEKLPYEVYTIFEDITEQKKAEETLRINNVRLNLAMSAANMAWWEMNIVTGNIMFENRKAEMLGFHPGDFTHYMDFMKLVHPEDAERAMEAMRKHIYGTEEKYETEYRILTKSGDYKWIHDIGSASTKDNNGKSIIVTGIVTDITERKKAEDLLHQSNERYKSLFNDNHSVMLLIQPETGNIIDANPTACSYYGWEHSELCSKNIADINTLSASELATELKNAKTEQRNHFFFKHKLASDEIRDVEVYSGPIRFGDQTMLYSIVHDITDKIQTEEALRKSESRVRMKLQSILSPEGSITDLDLMDIIDAPSIQKLMENFYELVQVPMAIIDNTGKVLVGVGWQDICTKYHRVHPESCKNCIESDLNLTEGIPDGEFKLYKCKNNLWDMATPVIIGGEHKGNLFMGQFFFDNEPIDYNLFHEQAIQYGFEEQDYMDALRRAPRLSQKKIDHSKAFFLNLSRSISQLSYSNIKLARAMAQQKQVEDALRESEEVLSKAQEIGHLGSWSLDLVTNRLTWTDEIYRIFGLEPKEFAATYEGFLDTIYPDDREPVNSAYTNSIREEKDSYEIEHRIVRKHSGEIRFVHEKCEHIRDTSGKIVRSVGMVHDITERKQAEIKLRESEERYKSFFQENYSVMMLLDPDSGEIIDANPAASNYYGWSHAELCHKNISEINPLSKKEVLFNLRGSKIKRNNHLFLKHKLANGELRDVEVYSGPIQFNESVLLHVIIHDITEKKQVEEELQRSKDNLRAILDATLESIYLFDKEGSVVEANTTAATRLNLQVKEIKGQKLSTLLPEGITRTRLSHLDEVFLTGKSVQFEDKRGEYDFEHNFFPVFNNEKVEHVVSFSRDITRQKQANEAILASEQKLSEIYASMSEGLAVHELIFDYSGKATDYRITEVNPAYEKITGHTRSDVLGRRASKIYALEEAPYLDIYSEVESTGNSTSFETYFYPMNKQFSISVFSPGRGRFVTVFRDVTIQKQAEEALRLSENRLDAVFNGVRETIMMMDISGNILAANQTALTRWRINEEGLTGKNWLSLLPPEIKNVRISQIDEMVQTGSPVRFEDNRNGLIYDITFYPIKETTGEFNQFVMFSSDITESKLAQEALHANEERYSLIYNSSRDSIFSFDLSGRITSANRSFCEEVNLEVSDILGSTFSELGLPELLTQEQDTLVDKVIETNNTVISELKIPVSDGTVRYYEIILNPMHDTNGNIIGIGGSARNITKRKEADQALMESEKRFRYLVKDIPVGVIQFGSNGEVIMSNPKAVELLGLNDDQIRKKYTTDEDWSTIREDGSPYPKEERPIPKTFSTGQQQKGVIIGVYREATSDYVWLLIDTVILFKEDGTIRNVVGTFIDITERKAKEETLRKLNQTLYALSKSSILMSQSENEADYLKQVCNIIAEDTDFAMVWIGYALEDEAKSILPVASAGFEDDYLNNIKLSWGDNEFGRGPTGVAIRTGKVEMCENMFTDPDFEPWREQALKRGYAASIVFPLKDGDKTFGAITIYSKEPDSFLGDEIKLLSKLASDLAHGITTLRLREAHKLAEEALIKSHSELEVQVKERTAELEKLNKSLKITEEKYRTVADFATNWEFWIGPKETMIYCSPSCERITGYTATDFALHSTLIYDIIHPDDLAMYQEHREKEKTAFKCEHEVQYRIYKKDGSMRWIGHFCRPVYNEEGIFKGTRGSNKDITARKKMEELLTTSNQKYKLLSENITDGIFICKNGKFEYINNAICDIFGYTAKELVGMKLTQLVMTDYHEELENFLYDTPDRNQSCVIEVECLRNDFTVVYVEVLLNYSAREKTVYGVVHDITEKKEFQKNMVKAIIQTEEKERAHFSKELHDGLGPLLSTIKLYLQWSERPNSKSSREEIVGKAGEILEEALAAVKEISNKLSPHLLINYGLNSAIKSFVEKLSATASYNIVFESNSTRRVDGNVEASLYRAIIECINNTLKYANANNIYIQLNDSGNQIQLRYRDDGTGFDINETISEHKGLGLFNLQNRLHTIGGKVELKSEPGQGVDYLFTVNV